MHLLPHLPFLGLALFSSSALAMTISQGTSLSTTGPVLTGNTTTLNATSNGGFVCSRRNPQTGTQPRFADCAGVLRFLSLDPTVGVFYNSGRGDFQLPYFKSYKTCTVVVELRSTYDKVQTSWLAVHQATMELNAACQDIRATPGLGFAFTYMDDLQSMKITLQGPRLGNGDGGTDTTETA